MIRPLAATGRKIPALECNQPSRSDGACRHTKECIRRTDGERWKLTDIARIVGLILLSLELAFAVRIVVTQP
ncbi:MAG: hypothetical protein V3U65_05935 [Granulosicoccaceae bacterium]